MLVSELGLTVWKELGALLGDALDPEVGCLLGDELGDELGNELGVVLGVIVLKRLGLAVGVKVGSFVNGSNVGDLVGLNKVSLFCCCNGYTLSVAMAASSTNNTIRSGEMSSA